MPVSQSGLKFWVVNERMRVQIQASGMSFLCEVAGLSLKDKVCSLKIWRNVKTTAPLYLKKPSEFVLGSVKDAPEGLLVRGFPGYSN